MAAGVPAHGDDALGAHLLGRKHAHQADRTIADHHHRRSFADLGCVGRIPAGAEHIGHSQQVRDEFGRRHFGGGDQCAIRQRYTGVRRLRARHELALHTRRLEAEAAMRAGVVGEAERADDELAGTDRAHLCADLDDDAAIFVAHMHRPGDRLQPTIGPQVRAADAACRQLDDGVRRPHDFRIGDFLAAYVARFVKNGCKHVGSFRGEKISRRSRLR
ncbi:hypothetical protein X767_10765 [Mesorhizobium sp. LSJC264A00]|nr:hypothetical protein X767_10765 [Mesorhizobium sp. LSJC264A00]